MYCSMGSAQLSGVWDKTSGMLLLHLPPRSNENLILLRRDWGKGHNTQSLQLQFSRVESQRIESTKSKTALL